MRKVGCYKAENRNFCKYQPPINLLFRGFGSKSEKWGVVGKEELRRSGKSIFFCLTKKMNVFLRNTFKELPWRFKLSFCRPYSGCLWAACFIGREKMNNVPPSCKAKTFCCIPQWLIYHTLKIPSGMQYLETRNTLITIINPASSPQGWRVGLAPCRRRDYLDPFGQVVKGFIFTSRAKESQRPGMHRLQGCTGSMQPLARFWVLLLQVTYKKKN